MNKKVITSFIAAGVIAVTGVTITDRQINQYTETISKYELALPTTIQNEGESKMIVSKDSTEVVMSRWNGEAQLGISYPNIQAIADRKLLSDKIKWVGKNETARAYPVTLKANGDIVSKTSIFKKSYAADPGDVDAIEFEIVWNQIPENFDVGFYFTGWENFNFYFQPPLTAEEIAEGATQPANVANSFAIYHKTKKNQISGGINYAGGKFGHIYRVKAIDAQGNGIWVDDVEYSNGLLIAHVDPVWATNAAYPVTIDPTFGKTSCGASNSTRGANTVNATFKGDTVADSATVDSISFCFDGNGAGTVNAKGVLYNYVADNNTIVSNGVSPSVLLPATQTGFTTSNYVSKPSIVSGNPYSPALVGDGTIRYYYDVTGSGGWFDDTNSYATPQDSGVQTSTARLMSIYITYTIEGGGATPNFGTLNVWEE